MNTEFSQNKNVIHVDKRERIVSFPIKHDKEPVFFSNENLAKEYVKNLFTPRYHGYNRSKDEIEAEIDVLYDIIWYNRHVLLQDQVENEGKYVDPEIWTTALKYAKEVEERYGIENLYFDDFEWGMINGKISALRWVLGDEWDNLES